MNKIKLFADSTSDLSDDLIKENDISVIPLYVNFDDEVYRDKIDIRLEEFFNKVEEKNKLPKTSAPSPVDFYKAFKPHIDAGDNIIYIGLSSHLSGTIQSATIAASEFPEGRIEIIDSLNVSVAIGFLVLKAADYIKKGLSFKNIVENLRLSVSKIKTVLILDTLDYLHKGGRCSAIQNLVGSILKIKPVIKIIDGKVAVLEKIRGKRERAIESLFSLIKSEKDKIKLDRIIVAHTIALEDAKRLTEKVTDLLCPKDLLILSAGCAISSHAGPGALGIVYEEK